MAINLAQFSKSGTGFGQGAYAAARQHYTDAQIRAAYLRPVYKLDKQLVKLLVVILLCISIVGLVVNLA